MEGLERQLASRVSLPRSWRFLVLPEGLRSSQLRPRKRSYVLRETRVQLANL